MAFITLAPIPNGRCHEYLCVPLITLLPLTVPQSDGGNFSHLKVLQDILLEWCIGHSSSWGTFTLLSSPPPLNLPSSKSLFLLSIPRPIFPSPPPSPHAFKHHMAKRHLGAKVLEASELHGFWNTWPPMKVANNSKGRIELIVFCWLDLTFRKASSSDETSASFR